MFNPADASLHIEQEYIDYIVTRYRFADQSMQRDFRKELKRIVAKGPILDIRDAFQTSHTIADLVEQGTLCSDFLRIEKSKPTNDQKLYRHKMPVTRPLYSHQEKAISIITGGHNAVITTGTGSGKTECFLVPVLDALLREEASGTLGSGVRAILIYPMNALANDQMKRLRDILMYYPSITFGVYNGDTKHKKSDALASYRELHENEVYKELQEPLPNELVSREQMQETPPHILCTNYAMLEHLLLRPDDDVLFQNANFRFVVLDEAHVYYGATGMETAFLLRRLKARLHSSHSVQFILTSATLGERGKCEESIVRFAENLTGEYFTTSDIIFGERLEQHFKTSRTVPLEIFSDIARLQGLTPEALCHVFEKNSMNYNQNVDVAENLYDLCFNAELYQKMRLTASTPISIHDLANLLSTPERSIIELVFTCSQASKDGKALIDARYHFFLRALEGAFLVPSIGRFSLERIIQVQENGISHMAFELAVCSNCGAYAFVGKITKDYMGVERLVQTSLFDDHRRYFQVLSTTEMVSSIEVLESEQSDSDDNEDDEDAQLKTDKELSIREYYLCPHCGAISDVDDGKPQCDCISPRYLYVREYSEGETNCPNCYGGKFYRLYLGNEAATAVLATALFEELPIKENEEKVGGVDEKWRGGKQFLAFSDNRGEAAFFAPYLHKTYEEFLRRRAIVQILQGPPVQLFASENGSCSLGVFVDELSKRFVREHTFVESLLPSCQPPPREASHVAKRQAWVAILNELIREKNEDGLVGLGFLQFRYLGNNDLVVTRLAEKYSVKKESVHALVDALVATIIAFGAVTTPDYDDLSLDDRKYVFYTERQKAVIQVRQKDSKPYHMGWLPRNREGRADQLYPNMRLTMTMRVLEVDQSTSIAFLDDYFRYLIDKTQNRKYYMERGNGNYYYLRAETIEVLPSWDSRANWYQCEKCGHVSFLDFGTCSLVRCDGKTKYIECKELQCNNHYAQLYLEPALGPLLIKEHTAQLSREEALAYQQAFERNEIHALSCSTTFEMGVDVGELETVFLRNVPPSASNYAQRAGRAGRSKNAAAYVLTYAKLSSHDFTFFAEPTRMIVGRILPPMFKIDNEKILMRHIYAVVLSYLFSIQPQLYGANQAKVMLEGGGLESLERLLNDKPEALTHILHDSFGDVLDTKFSISSYAWRDSLIGDKGAFSIMVADYHHTVEQFIASKNKAIADDNLPYAAAQKRRLELYQKAQTIETLARYNILPRYGFPVDTAELEVNGQQDSKVRVQLVRDLGIAISEYAPGAKIVANDNLFTSRYVKKSMISSGQYEFHYGFVYQCEFCKSWNFSKLSAETQCISCGKTILPAQWTESIEPRAGFVTEPIIDTVPMRRPDKFYHNEATHIGDGTLLDRYVYHTAQREICLSSTENDRIMITSKNHFYVCKFCGFAYGIHDIIRKKNGQINRDATKALRLGYKSKIETGVSHKTATGKDCTGAYLSRELLHHIFQTDVVQMDFDEYEGDESTRLSVTHAILRAISDKLDIEQSDLGACPIYKQDCFSIIFYDTVAGGAGHVRRLLGQEGAILEGVLQLAYQTMESCTCEGSCYSCLRGYRNQNIHEKLDRQKAAVFLVKYLGTCTQWDRVQQEEPHTIDM